VPAVDYVVWDLMIATNPYSTGAAFLTNQPPPPAGGWSNFVGDVNADFAFKTYVAPPTATPPPPATTPAVVPHRKCKRHKKRHSAAAAKKKCKKRRK
jgi:hypothetical protein